MSTLPDLAERVRALTDLDATLLVEAAAGTGKTALMAGRVVMLLARATPPRAIAAITFTDLAASALNARVHHYVDQLLSGHVPEPLRPVLPNGLDAVQRVALTAAAGQLDELTCATIHAFCQTLITSYAVEADVDPGARILDATAAEGAFDTVFDHWLKRRLGGQSETGDAIMTLSRDDPRRVVATLRDFARFRREHRGAQPPAADLGGRPDIDLVEAVAAFRRWLNAQPREPKTLEIADELERLAGHYANSFAMTPDFASLWRLAHPPRLDCMRRKTRRLIPPRTREAWHRAAGKAGEQMHDEAVRRFGEIDRSYGIILGRVATALIARLSDELDEVLVDYDAFKRSAAVLDFDDLLTCAQRLVREHESVRVALGTRYRHIFIDEFQDTDPVQVEVLFSIAAEARAPRWEDSVLRAGALFLVGDPKQSIYRFRGADVICYGEARDAIARRWPGAIVHVTANFRSRPAIIEYVNRCFAAPLSRAGHPNYVPLTPTLADPDEARLCVSRIVVDVLPETSAGSIRDAEAKAVADLCSRLIGHLNVRREDGTLSPVTPGDIALLTPTGAELWRYEHVLEAHGLPVASQAGKNLFRRQETQDIIALARTLADGRDTLALGALLRGPLVGLTDEELLDVTSALPAREGAETAARLSLRAPLDQIAHPLARRTLSILQHLRRRARVTTPALLLAEAVERLSIRPILAARGSDHGARAGANLDVLLERARAYGVTGLKSFVRDLTHDWRQNTECHEGRVDADGEAIQIHTIHTAKGMEWPVVIPINTATELPPRKRFIHHRSDKTLHWVIGDVVPPDLHAALEVEETNFMRERERLWYVACTRARDLLAIPDVAKPGSWGQIVDLARDSLAPFSAPPNTRVAAPTRGDLPNAQTQDRFAAERAGIDAASVPLTWIRPSDHDPDRIPTTDSIALEPNDAPEVDAPVGAGRVRGLLLHKLMEEVLTGELVEDVGRFASRARELLAELVLDPAGGGALPDVDEIAGTAWRTLHLPDVAFLRTRLIPEWPVYGPIANQPAPSALAGRIDAIAYDGAQADVVVDWKSDVAPMPDTISAHALQLGAYLRATNARRGALVYMTPGVVRWFDRSTA